MTIYDRCITLLEAAGAGKTKHSSRTLLDHLRRTYLTLRAANQPEGICIAGLMHSVYGTSAFKTKTLDASRRTEVRAIVGEETENLIWLFCQLDRSSALKKFAEGVTSLPFKEGGGAFEVLSDEHRAWLSDLLTIEAANLLDQQSLWKTTWLIAHARARGLLTEDGYSALRTSVDYASRRDAEVALMINNAKQGVRALLLEKINEQRMSVATTLIGGEEIRRHKFQQALVVLQAVEAGSLESVPVDSYMLVDSYATAYGATAADAAAAILDACAAYETKLLESEILKDAVSGRLARAQSLDEVNELRREVMKM